MVADPSSQFALTSQDPRLQLRGISGKDALSQITRADFESNPYFILGHKFGVSIDARPGTGSLLDITEMAKSNFDADKRIEVLSGLDKQLRAAIDAPDLTDAQKGTLINQIVNLEVGASHRIYGGRNAFLTATRVGVSLAITFTSTGLMFYLYNQAEPGISRALGREATTGEVLLYGFGIDASEASTYTRLVGAIAFETLASLTPVGMARQVLALLLEGEAAVDLLKTAAATFPDSPFFARAGELAKAIEANPAVAAVKALLDEGREVGAALAEQARLAVQQIVGGEQAELERAIDQDATIETLGKIGVGTTLAYAADSPHINGPVDSVGDDGTPLKLTTFKLTDGTAYQEYRLPDTVDEDGATIQGDLVQRVHLDRIGNSTIREYFSDGETTIIVLNVVGEPQYIATFDTASNALVRTATEFQDIGSARFFFAASDPAIGDAVFGVDRNGILYTPDFTTNLQSAFTQINLLTKNLEVPTTFPDDAFASIDWSAATYQTISIPGVDPVPGIQVTTGGERFVHNLWTLDGQINYRLVDTTQGATFELTPTTYNQSSNDVVITGNYEPTDTSSDQPLPFLSAAGQFVRQDVRTNGQLTFSAIQADDSRVVQTRPVDADGSPGKRRTEVRPANKPIITGDQIGAIFGTTIGSALGGSNVFARIGLSSALGTALSFLGGIFDPIVKGTKLAVFDPIKQAFTSAATIPATFVNNLITAGSNAAASFFTAELAEALGIKKDNFGKALFTFAGTTTINTVLKAATANLATSKAIFDGFGGTLFKAGSGALTPSALAPSFGSFIGSFLASRVVDIKNLGGSIGSSIGSAIGSIIGGAQTVLNAVTSALAITASTIASTVLSVVLPGIGAFIGYVFGAQIGNWLGKVFGIGVDHGGATYHTILEVGSTNAKSVRIFNDDDSFGRPARELSQAVADILTDLVPKTGAKAGQKITVSFHLSNTKGHGRQSYASVTGGGLLRHANGQVLLGHTVHYALKALDLSEANANAAAAITQLNTKDTTQILRRVGAAIAMDQILSDIFAEFGESKITLVNAPNFNVNHASDDAVIAFAKAEVVTLLKGNATLEFWHEVDGVTRFARIAWLDALLAGSTAITPEALALQISVAREYHNQLDTLENAIGGRMTRRLVSFDGVTPENAAETLEQEIVTTLKGAVISGGIGPAALYVKRALNRSTATTYDGLIADVRAAEDYSLYLRERGVIDALIAQNPESAFAASWLITLLKAGELGLAEVGADDFHAGFADLLQGYVIANTHDLVGISFADFELAVVPADGATSVAFELVFSRDAIGNPDKTLNLPNAFVLTGLIQLVSPSATTDGADLFEGTASNDNVAASAGHDVLRGNDGNDTLDGGVGNDLIDGGIGADTLTGGDGHDILRGGTGNDTLTGGAGDDVYLYREGDGSDTISDASGFDTLILGVGIEQPDITAARVGNNLVLTIAGGSVTLTDWYVIKNRIERVVFADGSVLDTEDLHGLTDDTGALGLGGKGKVIVAALNTIPQATVDPATGNFTMSVEGFEFSAEVGDVVSIVSGTTPEAVEQQHLAGATVQRYRYIGAIWVLTETEIYNADGTIASVDVVANPAAAMILRGDQLAFRADVSLDRIVIELNGDDMLVGVLDEDHSGPIPNVTDLEHVRLTGQLGTSPTVAKFVLADGTELSGIRTPATGPMELTALAGGSAVNGTARDDLIKGQVGADVLAGRGGNDRLEGREGDDTYRFTNGDGHDTIVDQRTVPASSRTERRREYYNVRVCGGEDGCYTERRSRWVTDTIHTPAREADAGSLDTLVLEGIGVASLVWQIVGNDLVIGILAADHSGAIPTVDSLADRITIKHGVDQSPIEKVVIDGSTFDLKVHTSQKITLKDTVGGNKRTILYYETADTTNHYSVTVATTDNVTLSYLLGRDDGTSALTEYHRDEGDTRDHTVNRFDASGRQVSQTVYNDDDSQVATIFDVAGSEAWKQRTRHYDASGRQVSQTLYNDDGTRVVTEFYLDPANERERLVTTYNADDVKTIDTEHYDDGRRMVWTYALDPTNPLRWTFESFNAEGVLILTTLLNGDGSYVTNAPYLDPAEERDYLVSTYNTDKVRTSAEVFFDDGRRTVWSYHLDADDPLTTTVSYYDTAGELTSTNVFGDDNTRTWTNFDVGNTKSWERVSWHYNAADVIEAQTHYLDDGGRILDTRAGPQTLVGNAGNDEFRFSSGDGHDTIDNAFAGGDDKITFSGAEHDQLLFKKVGDDLVVDVINTNDSVTVTDWFKAGADTKVDTIATANEFALVQKDVAKMVELMAGFDPTPAGATRLTSTQRTQVEQYFAGPSSATG